MPIATLLSVTDTAFFAHNLSASELAMKVVIAGATGTIGGGVLQRLLKLPAVTSVVALSRRKLDVEHNKLQVAMLKDFLHYEPDVLEQLSGAEACVW